MDVFELFLPWKQEDTTTALICWVLVGAVALFVIIMIACIAYACVQRSRRKQFAAQYNVKPAISCICIYDARNNRKTQFKLGFPSVYYQSAIGSSNPQPRTSVRKRDSMLILDHWRVTTTNPFAMYQLVVQLRETGVHIPLCAQEQESMVTEREYAPLTPQELASYMPHGMRHYYQLRYNKAW